MTPSDSRETPQTQAQRDRASLRARRVGPSDGLSRGPRQSGAGVGRRSVQGFASQTRRPLPLGSVPVSAVDTRFSTTSSVSSKVLTLAAPWGPHRKSTESTEET